MTQRYTLMEMMVIMGFLIVIAAVILGALLPVLTHSGHHRNRRKINCAGNLKQIGLAMLMYSGDHDGFFPNTHPIGSTDFEPLAQQNYIQNGKVWACPTRAEVLTLASNSAYVYISSGLKDDNDKATSVSLAYDEFGNHPRNSWMNVLFIDGHVEGATPGTKPFAHNEAAP